MRGAGRPEPTCLCDRHPCAAVAPLAQDCAPPLPDGTAPATCTHDALPRRSRCTPPSPPPVYLLRARLGWGLAQQLDSSPQLAAEAPLTAHTGGVVTAPLRSPAAPCVQHCSGARSAAAQRMLCAGPRLPAGPHIFSSQSLPPCVAFCAAPEDVYPFCNRMFLERWSEEMSRAGARPAGAPTHACHAHDAGTGLVTALRASHVQHRVGRGGSALAKLVSSREGWLLAGCGRHGTTVGSAGPGQARSKRRWQPSSTCRAGRCPTLIRFADR